MFERRRPSDRVTGPRTSKTRIKVTDKHGQTAHHIYHRVTTVLPEKLGSSWRILVYRICFRSLSLYTVSETAVWCSDNFVSTRAGNLGPRVLVCLSTRTPCQHRYSV